MKVLRPVQPGGGDGGGEGGEDGDGGEDGGDGGEDGGCGEEGGDGGGKQSSQPARFTQPSVDHLMGLTPSGTTPSGELLPQ